MKIILLTLTKFSPLSPRRAQALADEGRLVRRALAVGLVEEELHLSRGEVEKACTNPWAWSVLQALHRGMRQTLEGSFSAVSKQNCARKYAFKSSRRDLHNALLCTALQSQFFSGAICSAISIFLSKFANIFAAIKKNRNFSHNSINLLEKQI